MRSEEEIGKKEAGGEWEKWESKEEGGVERGFEDEIITCQESVVKTSGGKSVIVDDSIAHAKADPSLAVPMISPGNRRHRRANSNLIVPAENAEQELFLDDSAADHQEDSPRQFLHLGSRVIDYDKLQRSTKQQDPMDAMSHFRNSIGLNLPHFHLHSSIEKGDDAQSTEENPQGAADHFEGGLSQGRQFYIPPREEKGVGLVHALRSFIEGSFIGFVTWQFRTSFLNVVVVDICLYFFLIYTFTFILYIINNAHYDKSLDKECISGWDYEPSANAFRVNMELALALSWTTLSTVGYGAIGPANTMGCSLVRFICAMEAFAGLLFTGFCSAIFYAKVTRLHARAAVTFSSCLCLQYGSAVRHGDAFFNEEDERQDTNTSTSAPTAAIGATNAVDPSLSHFPFIEFRIVNDRANNRGGELVDASISCILKKNKLSRGIPKEAESESFLMGLSDDGPETNNKDRIPLVKRTFHRITFEPESHPMFSKAWHARHRLDQHSPLLKSSVRKEIEKSHREWWDQLAENQAQGGGEATEAVAASIRSALSDFEEIVVTVQGTSLLNASRVFAKKTYRFDDIYVGWQFASVFFLNHEADKGPKHDDKYNPRKLLVDHRLVHDILPQEGGGHEPLGSMASENQNQ